MINRHQSRNDGKTLSIDFVYHCAIKGARQGSDGGVFPKGLSGQSRQAVKRLGTAENGHGRQFLITDFTKNIKNPHFSASFDATIKQSPQAYSFKRSEFSDINNSVGATKHEIRPSDHTFNAIRNQ